jgi:hypothetical protein
MWAGEINGVSPDEPMLVIRWTGGRTDWPGFDWDVCGTDAYAAWMDPSHWHPLPEPPKGSKP